MNNMNTTLKTLQGMINILAAVICPAYTFWRAYKDFAPESFLWWCEVCVGVLVLVMFAVSLQVAFERGTYPHDKVKNCIDIE